MRQTLSRVRATVLMSSVMDGSQRAGPVETTQPEAGPPAEGKRRLGRQWGRRKQTLMSQEYQVKGVGASLVKLNT